MKIKVEGHNNLVRDSRTGAILNINKKSIEDARAAKAARKQRDSEIAELKSDVAYIKTLLEKLLAQNE